ncbi:hypothetical protein A3F29_03555 [Candidatus Roizmanbacteria bacterium RIFCSPHIGHO2_12_FULL_33_9]|uniref:Uncharacterized protein n=1 Tax=Candidatus Roizmanbacteria bacterium RIFCSPHIGHO2_12_FULL_33_9 TaxID=1802045 RepID=A0A1F7HI51_9BACT|nr:MAG: hypothetical protein A3F29_03555 [Candidatus Roizmanbacteria bacterium RIFCSPHIGHO2_12_FULL_33_9]
MILSPLIFIAQISLLYFLSRLVIKNLYSFFDLFIKSQKLVFSLVSLLYFPGTVIHEMSHFIGAIILFLNVRDIRLFPEFENDHIRLGSVVYEKKDFVRSILVGIAPFIFVFLIFFVISYFSLYPTNNVLLNVLFGYLIFAISSTMFSSKKDIVDLIYIIPLAIITVGALFLFDINILFIFENESINKVIFNFFDRVNYYLFFSLVINLVLLTVLKLTLFLAKSK